MSKYLKIKRLLSQAEGLVSRGELDQANACVRSAIPLGLTKADISSNLAKGASKALRAHTS